MDKCGICLKPTVPLFETGKDGVYACFKCQPLVPEVTLDDNNLDETEKSLSLTKEEDSDGSFYCKVCNKSFQQAMQLQNHMRNHRAERRFVCTYCNKAFSQSNNLRAHLRIHTNERPYKCQECGKAFTQVTNLNNHVRLHTGERPFVCPEPGCDKAYAQVTNLNQHRKRHMTGRHMEHSYDCTVCGERFSQRNHMYTHRREAHDIKSPARSARHACPQCAASLPSERLLRLHVQRHAPEPAERDEHKRGVSCAEWGVSCAEWGVSCAEWGVSCAEWGVSCAEWGVSCAEWGVLFAFSVTMCVCVWCAEWGVSCAFSVTVCVVRRVGRVVRVLSDEWGVSCVFSSCGARLQSAREHTEHLLRAHQLRVLTAHQPPPRRGRPPKMMKDPLELSNSDYDEVKVIKEEPQYMPKLKVQSLFQ
ncbi:zinc finger protein 814-like [Melitaea cinxia]|uniref:zinc finger protein 814-like n=1 Tax=Melitaea cinxia TaxID=113334 RepID=UPI001E2712BF|nr:zinc finger protein 814-like [Melitaea cinxia]